MEAKRFCDQVDDAVKILRSPDAAEFVTGRCAARGRSVAELVSYLSQDGLTFAPAVAGQERGYLALHRALSAYSISASMALSRQGIAVQRPVR